MFPLGLCHSSWDHHQDSGDGLGTTVKKWRVIPRGGTGVPLPNCVIAPHQFGDPNSMAQGSPIFLLTLTTGNCPTNFSRESSPLTPFPCKPIDIDTCEPPDPCTDVYKTQLRFMWEPDPGAYFIFPGFLEAIECTIHHCYSKNLLGGEGWRRWEKELPY